MKKAAPNHSAKTAPKGMALLSALITVMVVTALAATALWSQWSRFEVESAERQREQSLWLLTGALDWSRVILREDARASSIDTLAEPWAVPLQEVKLSSFIRDQNAASGTPSSAIGDTSVGDQVYLSGQIVDLQSKLNFYNLLAAQPVPPSTVQSFLRLFTALHLPQSELNQLVQSFQNASSAAAASPLGTSALNFSPPLWPQRFEQLAWWGLSKATLDALQPHATWISDKTLVNLNTASAQVLYASIPNIELSDAQRLVTLRESQPFTSLDQVRVALGKPSSDSTITDTTHQLSTRYFEVLGTIRMNQTLLREKSVLFRSSGAVFIVWRDRGFGLGLSPGLNSASLLPGSSIGLGTRGNY
jgi:general secretion pathway protein K